MYRKAQKIKKNLLAKGFAENRKTSHVFFGFITSDGIKTGINTHLSHDHGKDISQDVLIQMARQTKLSLKDFCNLVDCTMTQNDYEEHLKREGQL